MPKVSKTPADITRERILAVEMYMKKLQREERMASQLSSEERETLNATFSVVRTDFADLDGIPTRLRAKPLTPSCTPNRARTLSRTHLSAAIFKASSSFLDSDDQNVFTEDPQNHTIFDAEDQTVFTSSSSSDLPSPSPLVLKSGHPCSPPPARLSQQELDSFRDDETIRASGRSPDKLKIALHDEGDDSDAESTFSFNPGRRRRAASRLFGYADDTDDTASVYSYTQERPTSRLSFTDENGEGVQYATFTLEDAEVIGDEDEEDVEAERAIQRALALRGMVFGEPENMDVDEDEEE